VDASPNSEGTDLHTDTWNPPRFQIHVYVEKALHVHALYRHPPIVATFLRQYCIGSALCLPLVNTPRVVDLPLGVVAVG